MSRLKKLSKFYKICSCKNLGNIIDSNTAINTIQNVYGSDITGSNQVYSFSGNLEAVYGYISDNGFIAAELYCFKQEDKKFIGVIVGQKFYIDNNGNVAVTETPSCQMLNDANSTTTIDKLDQMFTSGSFTLCGVACTFANKINSVSKLQEQLKAAKK